MEQFKTLVLGIGRWPEPLAKGEVVGVDKIKTKYVDIVWDLDEFPYPFKDKEFDLVVLRDVLEHLTYPEKTMFEVHRILKDGGKVFVRVPDANYPENWHDLSHKRLCTIETFDIFDPTTEHGKLYDYYYDKKYKILEKKLNNKGIDFWLLKI